MSPTIVLNQPTSMLYVLCFMLRFCRLPRLFLTSASSASLCDGHQRGTVDADMSLYLGIECRCITIQSFDVIPDIGPHWPFARGVVSDAFLQIMHQHCAGGSGGNRGTNHRSDDDLQTTQQHAVNPGFGSIFPPNCVYTFHQVQ